MALTVLRSARGLPRVYPDLASGYEVLLFDPIEERGNETVGERFRMVDPSLRRSDAIVFRSSSRTLRAQLESDQIVSELIRDTPLYTLERSYESDDPSPTVVPIAGSPELDSLRLVDLMSAEVESILLDTGSIIRAEAHHYLLPSGWHADGFVRLGNATRSIPATRRLADWVLSNVDRRTAILADTGTILPVLFEVQRHCKKHFGWKCRIDALEAYPDVKSVVQAIDDLRRRHGEDDSSVLFAISVSSSGRTRRRFESAANQENGDRSMTLVETSEAADPVLPPLLVLPLESWPPAPDGSCDGCTNPAHVQIHPGSYDQMSTLDVKGVPVDPSRAQQNADFFQVASDLGAVHLHHTNERGTHCAVWLDTPKLLSNENCRMALRDLAIKKMSTASLLLVPEGPATSELVAVGETALGMRAHVVPAGERLPLEAIDQLRNADNVAVLDDTISTGTTLTKLRRAVFYAAQEFGRNPDMTAVVFVARPSRPRELLEVRRPYRTSEPINVHWVHEVMLPSGRDCPWCDEIQLLQAWLVKLPDSVAQTAIKRIGELQGGVHGGVLLGPNPSMELRTEGSFFGSLHEKTAFAAVSSAVLTLQTELVEINTPGTIKIVGIEPALDAYFDPILLAAILRTVAPARVASIDALISAKYPKIADLGADFPDVLRVELGWAVIRDVLPEPGFDPVIDPVMSEEAELVRHLLKLRRTDRI